MSALSRARLTFVLAPLAVLVVGCSGNGTKRPVARDVQEEAPVAYDPVACMACDREFECSVTSHGETMATKLVLRTVGRACATEDKTSYLCGGTIVSGGKVVGTWKRNGAGFDGKSSGGDPFSCKPTDRKSGSS